jgi:hypothetical protein
MTVHPLDLPSLVSAVAWPLIVIFGLVFFRHPVTDLVAILGQRIHKFSFEVFSLELAEVKEMHSRILDTEIRKLDVGLAPQSGSTAISQLLAQLQGDRRCELILFDLGSESLPRWLTSRLNVPALRITLIERFIRLVFVSDLETRACAGIERH